MTSQFMETTNDNTFKLVICICSAVSAAALFQISSILQPIGKHAEETNQCIEERTAYWMKNDKKPGPHTRSRLVHWCNGGK
ncbi:hypothetical protein PMIT1342_02645 [Prochlorococcus marinus str. MIT 1342]|nr:hypothetical protein PMIT1342_02645 [Prochlorococcus marinus str. MIT 1342]